MLLDLSIVLLLIALNGFFAMSELAVVSARKARLQMAADRGHSGSAVALRLAEHPGRFLGIFAGAFGAARLAGPLAVNVEQYAWLAPYSEGIAMAIVVSGLTYLSLILGELAPKQLALRHAEFLASFVARPMALLAWLAAPLVFLLDRSSKMVLRLLGASLAPEPAVTDEEIKMLVAEATRAGVVKQVEQTMIEGVMRLADRPVGVIMTPRPDLVWIDLRGGEETARQTLIGRGAESCRAPTDSYGSWPDQLMDPAIGR